MDRSRHPVAEIQCDCGKLLPGESDGVLLYWACPECGEMQDVDV
jgi:predicted RNA-binding Zn-ribbon protein involved in translation (DUF1610 family)